MFLWWFLCFIPLLLHFPLHVNVYFWIFLHISHSKVFLPSIVYNIVYKIKLFLLYNWEDCNWLLFQYSYVHVFLFCPIFRVAVAVCNQKYVLCCSIYIAVCYAYKWVDKIPSLNTYIYSRSLNIINLLFF